MNKKKDYDLINRVYKYLEENHKNENLKIRYKEDKEVECTFNSSLICSFRYNGKMVFFNRKTRTNKVIIVPLYNKTDEEIFTLIDHTIENIKNNKTEKITNNILQGINYPISIKKDGEEYFNNLKEYIIEDHIYLNKVLTRLDKTVLAGSGAEGRVLAALNQLENVKDIKTQCLLEEKDGEVLVAPIVALLDDNSIIVLIAVKEEKNMFTNFYIDEYKKISEYCEKNGLCYGMRSNSYKYIKEYLTLSFKEEDMYEEAEKEIMNKIKETSLIGKKQLKEYMKKYTEKVIYNILFNNSDKLIIYKDLSTIKYKKEV